MWGCQEVYDLVLYLNMDADKQYSQWYHSWCKQYQGPVLCVLLYKLGSHQRRDVQYLTLDVEIDIIYA